MTTPHLLSVILAFLRTLPVPAIDAHEVDRDARLIVIATAINSAAEHATCTGEFAVDGCKAIAGDPVRVAAELVELARAETDLRSNVHRDECGPHECDSYRLRVKGATIIMHRARGLWQPHKPPEWTAARWESIRGATLEATTNAAWEATKMLAGYKGLCHNGSIGMFAGYATGRQCHYKHAERRASRAEQIRWRLVALMGKEGC